MATPLAIHTYPSAINTINSLEVVDLSGKGTYESEPVGEIPSSIGDLSNLEYFSLDANSYTGNIPEEISKLTELNYLNIYDTSVENFPTEEIVGLENLETLIFRSNSEAEGTVTSEIFELPNLKTVEFVANDNLEGEFSTNEIVYNNSMSRVEIANQDFTGIIDENILDWEALNYIYISNTGISVPNYNEIGQGLDEAGVCSVYLMNGSDFSDIYVNDGWIDGC